MAVNREPILKRCRALGISPAVLGYNKNSNRNPDADKRKKVSKYGSQLKEKQKLKFIYGVLEKQFRHYYDVAAKMEGKTGENMLTLLELRLDNVIWRMGIAPTRREARQMVSHEHFDLNGKKVNIPSILVKAGDVIAVKETSKENAKIKALIEGLATTTTPKWLELNAQDAVAKVATLPARDDIDFEFEEQLIVELYSK